MNVFLFCFYFTLFFPFPFLILCLWIGKLPTLFLHFTFFVYDVYRDVFGYYPYKDEHHSRYFKAYKKYTDQIYEEYCSITISDAIFAYLKDAWNYFQTGRLFLGTDVTKNLFTCVYTGEKLQRVIAFMKSNENKLFCFIHHRLDGDSDLPLVLRGVVICVTPFNDGKILRSVYVNMKELREDFHFSEFDAEHYWTDKYPVTYPEELPGLYVPAFQFVTETDEKYEGERIMFSNFLFGTISPEEEYIDLPEETVMYAGKIQKPLSGQS